MPPGTPIYIQMDRNLLRADFERSASALGALEGFTVTHSVAGSGMVFGRVTDSHGIETFRTQAKERIEGVKLVCPMHTYAEVLTAPARPRGLVTGHAIA